MMVQGFRLKAYLVHLVYLVCLVCLVYLLTQTNRINQTNQIDKTDQMTRQSCLQPEPLQPNSLLSQPEPLQPIYLSRYLESFPFLYWHYRARRTTGTIPMM